MMLSCVSINRVKRASPLFEAMQRCGEPGYIDHEIADFILQRLPRGSTRQQTEAFIANNFNGVTPVIRYANVPNALYRANGPYIFIRPMYQYYLLAGHGRVEIYFLLTNERRLKDVVVRCESAYL